MENEDALLEEEWNYHKAFYAMAEKVDIYFAVYEKTMVKPDKKEGPDDHASVNHEGGGEKNPEPPSPSFNEITSSSSSHHSSGGKYHKNPFFKLDVKFDLHVFSGEPNAKNLDN